MKKMLLGSLFLIVSAAYAVSIDFQAYQAVEIGELQTHRYDDGVTVEHSIEFSGPGLAALAATMPEVIDITDGSVVPGMKMFSISNAGQPNVPADKTTTVYVECNVESATTKCSIRIIRGTIPG